MYLQGLGIGLLTFVLIGIFHPIVIKSEYYWGKKTWPAFALAGCLFCLLSILTAQLFASILLGVLACCCFWSIGEVREQEERVVKGWFPENPRRRAHYEELRRKRTEQDLADD